MDQDDTWHGGRPWPWRHSVTWGLSFPPKRDTGPQISAHVCCDQTAGWIQMLLGMKVGLGPGHIVVHGTHPPPKKMAGAQPPPQFLAHIYCGQTVVLSAVAELLLLYLQLTVINNFTLFVLPLTNV